MTDLNEPRIRCPSCGRPAPAMRYCIHCGAKLPETAPRTVGAPPSTSSTLPPVPPTVAPPTAPASAPPTVRVVPSSVSVGVREEVANLMSGITVLYVRKAALLELFQSGQVSEGVFVKLYKEYSDKLDDFLKARVTNLEELRNRLEESNRHLNEISMRLEELGVRRIVGEIDANDYNLRVEKLRSDQQELGNSVKRLRANIDHMDRMFSEKKPSEIRDLEAKLLSYQSTFERLFEAGKFSAETHDAIKPDMKRTLNFFDSLIKDQKENERRLREQLETLQTRYRLSEISIEEYEKRKRELQAEIDKIWA